ncbi:MAG: flagellin [Hyphomicrobium zavarzinii]|jgi:flagellin|uniref:flagellin N-terminal helical domain-containing protein n=1 Tax=Hyphomicrobium TaxID=81 RepID=UPI00037F94F0|nr:MULTISPECIES: flagellin [Hyphomicrobium]MBL8847761.1 flagellin [Hyphomicrobium zavarzinii]WBT39267.1 flagellin [Hyphomicrobium sp. DMF-1]HML43422.1 flagellin [Hyphomicrobium zavarzinii]
MSSLNTNVAAMTALQTLNKTNKDMLVTQNRISTGLRVKDASDNAAYWSIATTMRSDNMAVSTVQDALGLGAATADVTVTAMNSAIETVSKIKAKLVAARAPGLDRGKIQSEISALQTELRSTAESAVFSGENWLMTDSTGIISKTIVASYSRDSTGEITIGKIEVNVGPTGTMLFDTTTSGTLQGVLDKDRTTTAGTTYTAATLDISTITDDTADLADLEDMIRGVDDALSSMTDAATVLGAARSRINLQKDFVSKLIQSIDTGIGQLVDAEMNEESTRLQALQVRQQLGVQALGIANQSAQQILQLFQG